MSRTVTCAVLKKDAEGMETPPHPGNLGQRIYDNVSAEGWKKWLERLTMIINENSLSTADASSLKTIENHMIGFLFGEGEMGATPAGFQAAPAKK